MTASVTALPDDPRPTPQNAAPLRALDSVAAELELRGGLRVRATKRVTVTDPYLGGHFPELTVYPGVFTLESVGQAVSAAIGPRSGRPAVLCVLRSARFLVDLMF